MTSDIAPRGSPLIGAGRGIIRRVRGDDLVARSQAADLVLRRRILCIVKVYSELL